MKKIIAGILTAALLSSSVSVFAAVDMDEKIKNTPKSGAINLDFGLPDQMKAHDTSTVWDTYLALKEELPQEANVIKPAEVSGKTQIFVATNGNDSNPGTIDAPVKTVEKAIELATAVPNKEEGIVIYFREGNYSIKDHIVIDKELSGTNEHPVFFSSYNNENVNISSAVKLDYKKFKMVDDFDLLNVMDKNTQDNIKVATFDDLGITAEDVKIGVSARPKILYNGAEMSFSRYPASAYIRSSFNFVSRLTEADGFVDNVTYWGDYFKDGKVDPGFTYTEPEKQVYKWKKSNNIWVHGRFAADHFIKSYRVDKIDDQAGTVKTMNSITFFGRLLDQQKTGERYYWNIIEEVKTPGDMAIDLENEKIYIYPYDDSEDPELFLIRGLKRNEYIWLSDIGITDDALITLEECENIIFNGINFGMTNDLCLRFTDSFRCVVQNCNFQYAFGALQLVNDTAYSGMIYCNVFSMGDMGGVRFNGAKSSDYFKRNFVQNCAFSKLSESTFQYPSSGSVFSHNIITHVASMPVYPDGLDQNITEYNEIYDAPNVNTDGGMIYVGGPAISCLVGGTADIGSQIRYNYLHGSRAVGIYNDDCGTTKFVYGNIIDDLGTGIKSHNANYLAWDNNIVMNTTRGLSQEPNYFYRYLGVPAQALTSMPSHLIAGYPRVLKLESWYPFLKEYFDLARKSSEERMSPTYSGEGPTQILLRTMKHNNIRNNYLWNSTLIHRPEASLEDPGEVSNNILSKSDPGFVDYENGDLNLKEDAPIYNILPGFEATDFTKIGPESDLQLLDTKISCYAPTDKSKIEGGEIVFRWSPKHMAGKYKLVVALDKDMKKVLDSYSTIETSYLLKLTEPGTYYWRVEPVVNAKTMNIDSTPSEIHSFEISD